MNLRAQRFLLVILGLSGGYVGAWALLAPSSFYNSFPGLGRHWVVLDGPYNEHLVRDVGGLYLALVAVTVWAAVRPDWDIARVAGLGWSAFSVPHLAYHAGHLDEFGTGDQVANLVALGGTLVLGLALLGAPRRWRPTRPPRRRQAVAPVDLAAGSEAARSAGSGHEAGASSRTSPVPGSTTIPGCSESRSR